MQCSICLLDIAKNTESIQCYGWCGRTFHLTCLTSDNEHYKKPIIGYLNNIHNLHWYCDNCHIHSMDGISKTLKECVSSIIELKRITPILSALCQSPLSQPKPFVFSASHTDNTSATSSHIASAATSVNNGLTSVPINTDNPTNIDNPTNNNSQTNINNPTNNNNQTRIEDMVIDVDKLIVAETSDKTSKDLPLYSFVVSTGSSQPVLQSAKRKIGNHPSPIPLKIQKKKGDLSSNRAVQTPVSVETRANNQLIVDNQSGNSNRIMAETSCIYISKFKPEIEDSMILRHLNSIGVVDSSSVQCKRLVRTNSSGRKITFVSFKIFVPSIHTNTVLNQLNWPNGTIVRMFEDKSSNIVKNHNAQQNSTKPKKISQPRKHNDAIFKQNKRAPMINQTRNIEHANWYQPNYATLPQRSIPFFPSAPFSQQMMPYPCFLPQMPPIYQQQQQMNYPQLI